MKKFALGLHHINIAYVAGNYESYHRQVTESLIPLLDMLQRHSNWQFNIELSGYSIDFIAKHYPLVIDKIAALIDTKKIELISAEYAPRIWICFPRSDMLKSIEMNQKLLLKYGLNQSRIFFAQENFFGEGVKSLSEWFDIAVVKDDYFFHLYESLLNKQVPPFYNFDNMKLLVGWGHILEEMAGELFKIPFDSNFKSNDLKQFVKKKYQHWSEKKFELLYKAYSGRLFGSKISFKSFQYKYVEWTWYHFGSSERFTKFCTFPGDAVNYKFEHDWISLAEMSLERYETKGYNISGINTFVNAINDNFNPESAPPLIEGAWNMKKSRGCFVWMGYNEYAYQDDLEIRNQNNITRNSILDFQMTIHQNKQNSKFQKFNKILQSVWKYQLLSETSDSTGWHPRPCEVEFSLLKSKRIHIVLTALLKKYNLSTDSYKIPIKNIQWQYLLNPKFINKSTFTYNVEKIGSTIDILSGYISDNSQLLIIKINPKDKMVGISFDLVTNIINYSPSLLEKNLMTLDLDTLSPEVICLPLTNGLISISPDLHIIKNNNLVSIGCQINRKLNKVIFVIENPVDKEFVWEFYLTRGDVNVALVKANELNRVV